MDGNLLPLPDEVRSRLRSGVAITSVAQCVEELVLNSIDAGSTCIAIRLDMSCCKIQVIDNGSGLPRNSLIKVADRYTTSKCHSIQDLDENLQHYGYRGEALASIRDIASVLEIQSKAKHSTLSHTRTFQKSKPHQVSECQLQRPSAGTTVTIHDLFCRLPVRKKCLSETIELERVRQRIEGLSLIHPTISFSIRNDATGAKLLQTHKASSVLGTFTHLFGSTRTRNLCPVSGAEGSLKVDGYIGKESHHNKNLQFIFVNKRLVLKTKLHRMINFFLSRSAIARKRQDNNFSPRIGSVNSSSPQRSYGERHGIYVVDITCKYSDYDITFDPSKTLIEFKEWRLVVVLMEKMVRDFLLNEGLVNAREYPEDPPDIDKFLGQYIDEDDDDDSKENDQRIGELNDVGKALYSLRKYAAGIHTFDRTNNLTSETVSRPKNIDPQKIVEEIIAEKNIEEKQRIVQESCALNDVIQLPVASWEDGHSDRSLMKGWTSLCSTLPSNDKCGENILPTTETTLNLCTTLKLNQNVKGKEKLTHQEKVTLSDETTNESVLGELSARQSPLSTFEDIYCNEEPNRIPDPPNISRLTASGEGNLSAAVLHCRSSTKDIPISLGDDSLERNVIPSQKCLTVLREGITQKMQSKQYEKTSDSESKDTGPISVNIHGMSSIGSNILEELRKKDEQKLLAHGTLDGTGKSKRIKSSELTKTNKVDTESLATSASTIPCKGFKRIFTSTFQVLKSKVDDSRLEEETLTGFKRIRKALAANHKKSKTSSPSKTLSLGLDKELNDIHEIGGKVSVRKVTKYSNIDSACIENSEKEVMEIKSVEDKGLCSKIHVTLDDQVSCGEGYLDNYHGQKAAEFTSREISPQHSLGSRHGSRASSTASISGIQCNQINAFPVPSTSPVSVTSDQEPCTAQTTALNAPETSVSKINAIEISQNRLGKRPKSQNLHTNHLPLAAKLCRLSKGLNKSDTEIHGKVFSMVDMMLETTQEALRSGISCTTISQSQCLDTTNEPDRKLIAPETSEVLYSSSTNDEALTKDNKDDKLNGTTSSANSAPDPDKQMSFCDEKSPDFLKSNETRKNKATDRSEEGQSIEEFRRRRFGKTFPLMKTRSIPVIYQEIPHSLSGPTASQSTMETLPQVNSNRISLPSTLHEVAAEENQNVNFETKDDPIHSTSNTKLTEVNFCKNGSSVRTRSVFTHNRETGRAEDFACGKRYIHQYMDYSLEFFPLQLPLEKTVENVPLSVTQQSNISVVPPNRCEYRNGHSEILPSQGFKTLMNSPEESDIWAYGNIDESQAYDINLEHTDSSGDDVSDCSKSVKSKLKTGNHDVPVTASPPVYSQKTITEKSKQRSYSEKEENLISEMCVQTIICSKANTQDAGTNNLEAVCVEKEESYSTKENNQQSPGGNASTSGCSGKTLFTSGSWICKLDPNSGKKMFINTVTGCSRYDDPCDLNQGLGDKLSAIRFKNQIMPKGESPPLNKNLSVLEPLRREHHNPSFESNVKKWSNVSKLFAEHTHDQNLEESEERSIKWRSVCDLESAPIADMYDQWLNPIFKDEEKVALALQAGPSTKGAVQVQEAIYPYKFNKSIFSTIKVLGQVDNKFIACSMTLDQSLPRTIIAVIDQHAAHERVRLERLTAEAFTKDGVCLVKTDLEPALKIVLKDEYFRVLCAFKSNLDKIGLSFSTNKDDRNAITVHSIPSCLSERDVYVKRRVPDRVVVELIENLLEEEAQLLLETNGACGTIPNVINKVLNSQACHGAIKFGDHLSKEECDQLILELSKCQLPFQCAHGRPSVMPILDMDNLQRHFPSKGLNPPRLWKILDRA